MTQLSERGSALGRISLRAVFTGIVRELGSVAAVEGGAAGVRLLIEAPVTARGTELGDSISVDGVCLTATAVVKGQIAFDAVAETLSRSTLGGLVAGAEVNLEPATSSPSVERESVSATASNAICPLRTPVAVRQTPSTETESPSSVPRAVSGASITSRMPPAPPSTTATLPRSRTIPVNTARRLVLFGQLRLLDMAPLCPSPAPTLPRGVRVGVWEACHRTSYVSVPILCRFCSHASEATLRRRG